MIDYTFYPADSLLSEYIFSFGVANIAKGTTAPLLSPPNGLTGFIIKTKGNRKAKLVAQDYEGNAIANQPSYAIGQTTFPIIGYAIGQLTLLVVFFQPLGMYQLFAKKMDALTNKSVSLLDFLGKEKGQALIKKLQHCTAIEKQIIILNNFFLDQQIVANDCNIVKKVLTLIYESKGNISIKKIEETLAVNRRTIERHFISKIGISPKLYSQVFRFKCAMNYLQTNPTATWTALTYNNGFFDQAHMIRYFKEYLKVSPNNLVKLDLDFINYLLKH